MGGKASLKAVNLQTKSKTKNEAKLGQRAENEI